MTNGSSTRETEAVALLLYNGLSPQYEVHIPLTGVTSREERTMYIPLSCEQTQVKHNLLWVRCLSENLQGTDTVHYAVRHNIHTCCCCLAAETLCTAIIHDPVLPILTGSSGRRPVDI